MSSIRTARGAGPLRLLLLGTVLGVLTTLAAPPSGAATWPQRAGISAGETRPAARSDVPGCSAFSGARPLGAFYEDAYVRIFPCGTRPTWDGARTGGGPVVRPFAGSPVYYRGYQCIELVARFLKARFDVDPGVANGAQAVDRYAAAYPEKFVKITNGTRGRAPRKGDVLSLSGNRRFDDVGHTGIVVSSSVNRAGNGRIRAVEENWGGAGGNRGYHDYRIKRWRVLFAPLPHIRWLRAR